MIKMKKLLPILLAAAFIISSLTGCSLDLSHKHYTDDFGFCKTCDTDLCRALRESGSILTSGSVNAADGETLYFSFKPNGAGSTVIKIVSESAVLDERGVDIYTRDSYGIGFIPLYSDDGNVKILKSNGTLDTDTVYYIRFTVKRRGTVTVNIDCHVSDI